MMDLMRKLSGVQVRLEVRLWLRVTGKGRTRTEVRYQVGCGAAQRDRRATDAL